MKVTKQTLQHSRKKEGASRKYYTYLHPLATCAARRTKKGRIFTILPLSLFFTQQYLPAYSQNSMYAQLTVSE